MLDRPFIPLYRVHMPSDICTYLEPVLLSGMITEGEKSKEFEERFQKYIGNPNTAMVNSGTSALTLAGRLVGVSPDTEVISSPLTCLATTEWVLNAGAKIVWCDVDPKTGNIDANKIEALITPKTKAILFVDWAGTPAELDKINAVAKTYNLKVIEDAAHAIGSKYKGRMTGTSCDLTMFSLQAIKHLTVGDGGALACKTKEDYDKTVLLRWFGMARGHTKSPVCWEGDVLEPGYKFHMNNINATIGLEQLKYIDNIVAAHKNNGKALTFGLAGIDGLELCEIPDYIESSFWFYTIKLRDTAHREEVSAKLLAKGIGNAITHTRNDKYSLFEAYRTRLPALDDFGSRMLNIPSGWWVNNNDLDYIIETLKEVI